MRTLCDGSGFLDCYCAGDSCGCGVPRWCDGCYRCDLQREEEMELILKERREKDKSNVY